MRIFEVQKLDSGNVRMIIKDDKGVVNIWEARNTSQMRKSMIDAGGVWLNMSSALEVSDSKEWDSFFELYYADQDWKAA